MTLDLLDRRLLFVTGKGGVGKSTVAAALALLGSQHGRRTLACEVDAKGNLADFYEMAAPLEYIDRKARRAESGVAAHIVGFAVNNAGELFFGQSVSYPPALDRSQLFRPKTVLASMAPAGGAIRYHDLGGEILGLAATPQAVVVILIPVGGGGPVVEMFVNPLRGTGDGANERGAHSMCRRARATPRD